MNSRVIEVLLMRRLSVLSVTRNRKRRSMPMGWSAIDPHTPVFTFEIGHNSSGMRRSRTNSVSRPRTSWPGSPVRSSTKSRSRLDTFARECDGRKRYRSTRLSILCRSARLWCGNLSTRTHDEVVADCPDRNSTNRRASSP